MRIALWNASGLDNLGDLVLDRVNRRELGRRLPGAEFTSFCPWPIRDGVQKLSVSTDGLWPGHGHFAAIVVGGGALLMGPPLSHPGLQTFFFGGHPDRFQDRTVRIWNAVCSDSRVPSPYVDAWASYVQDAAAQCDLVSVRNSRTFQFLRDWGVNGNISVVPDPAILAATLEDDRVSRSRKLTIGWLAAQPEFPHEFIELMKKSAMADWSDANSSIVKLSASAPSNWGDARLARRVAHLVLSVANRNYGLRIAALKNMYGDADYAMSISEEFQPIVDCTKFDEDLGSVLAWMRSVDCVIASRLHHCIFAVAAGIPVIALDLYYSPVAGTSKLREFMTSCDLAEFYIEFANEGLSTDLNALVRMAVHERERVLNACGLLQTAARQHFDDVASCIRTRATVERQVFTKSDEAGDRLAKGS